MAKTPQLTEAQLDEYFQIAIPAEEQRLARANVDIAHWRKRKPGGAPGWGYYDTAAGIRKGLQNAKRERLEAQRNLKKLRAGIPLFVLQE